MNCSDRSVHIGIVDLWNAMTICSFDQVILDDSDLLYVLHISVGWRVQGHVLCSHLLRVFNLLWHDTIQWTNYFLWRKEHTGSVTRLSAWAWSQKFLLLKDISCSKLCHHWNHLKYDVDPTSSWLLSDVGDTLFKPWANHTVRLLLMDSLKA